MPLLTATGVVTADVLLSCDEESRMRNEAQLLPLFGEQTKMSGIVEVMEMTARELTVAFQQSGSSSIQYMQIATAGSAKQPVEAYQNTDHVQHVRQGGNAWNEVENITAWQKAIMGSDFHIQLFKHPTVRTMLQIPGLRATYVLGTKYPSTFDPYVQYKDVIQSSTAHISDVHLASFLHEDFGEGHRAMLNPTSGLRSECGRSAVDAGRAPAVSLGLSEMQAYLQGMLHEEDQFSSRPHVIHDCLLDEHRSFFHSGVLNPMVSAAIDQYGWQYNELLYNATNRNPEFPCDIVLTAGPAGGGVRVRDLWSFSGPPSTEAERKLLNSAKGSLRHFAQEYVGVTDATIKSTPGCGDAVASVQAMVNVTSEQILRMFGPLQGKVADIALQVYAAISMRLVGVLTYRTQGTNLAHLPAYFWQNLNRLVIEDSVNIANNVQSRDLQSPRKSVNVLSPKFGIPILLWRQSMDYEWPLSPIPQQLHGVARDEDFFHEGYSI